MLSLRLVALPWSTLGLHITKNNIVSNKIFMVVLFRQLGLFSFIIAFFALFYFLISDITCQNQTNVIICHLPEIKF